MTFPFRQASLNLGDKLGEVPQHRFHAISRALQVNLVVHGDKNVAHRGRISQLTGKPLRQGIDIGRILDSPSVVLRVEATAGQFVKLQVCASRLKGSGPKIGAAKKASQVCTGRPLDMLL